MMKPSFINLLIYLFVKHLAFYLFLMLKNGNYQLLEVGTLKNGEDWFYYLWLILFLPVISFLVFSAPIYFSFKVDKAHYFLLIIGGVLTVEYFAYTYLASQADPINGLYNGVISILFLLLFFFKSIKTLFFPSSPSM